MNKRYIDFVPSNKSGNNGAGKTPQTSVRATGAKSTSTAPRPATPARASVSRPAAPSRASTPRPSAPVRASVRTASGQMQAGARPVRKPVTASRSTSGSQGVVSGHVARQSTKAVAGQAQITPSTVRKAASPRRLLGRRAKSEEPVIRPKGSIFAEVPSANDLRQPRSSEQAVRRTETEAMMEFSVKDEPNFGVIEEMNSKFVSTTVEKRPLSDGTPLPQPRVADAKEAKSRKLVGRKLRKTKEPVENPVEKSAVGSAGTHTGVSTTKGTFSTPKSPFINQDKVVKRPLSKNVYQKKVVTPKEDTGTVTIISKPEKDKHVSLIISIIITIILGAAAGTVAFLLLPK